MIQIDWLWGLAGSLVTLGVWSVAFRETPFYRFVEHTMVGAIAGYLALVVTQSIFSTGLRPVLDGSKVWLIIPLILGAMMFSRWTKLPWLYRYPFAIVVSTGTALALRTVGEAQISSQIKELLVAPSGNLLFAWPNKIIAVVMTIASTVYFIFTVPRAGTVGKIIGPVDKFGRYTLMAAFGIGFMTFAITSYTFFLSSLSYIINFLLGR